MDILDELQQTNNMLSFCMKWQCHLLFTFLEKASCQMNSMRILQHSRVQTSINEQHSRLTVTYLANVDNTSYSYN